jgi:hypothetical protein
LQAKAKDNAVNAFARLTELGCSLVAKGSKIVLIEAAVKTDSEIWRGRIYPSDGRPPSDAYFPEISAFTYAEYGPFSGRDEAMREAGSLVERLRRMGGPNLPYDVTDTKGGFAARIGPFFWRMMNQLCRLAPDRQIERDPVYQCRVLGQLPGAADVKIGDPDNDPFLDLNNPRVMAEAMWCLSKMSPDSERHLPSEPKPQPLTSEQRELCAPLLQKLITNRQEYERKKAEDKAAAEARKAEEQRRTALPHNDPGAVSLCAPPRKMTREGCQ